VTQRDDDPYSLLGVTPSATSAEITHAFRAKLRMLHPDTRIAAEQVADDDHDDDVELRRVLAAYVQLRRSQHDRAIGGELRESSSRRPMFRAGPVRRES
jgi:DnaJ-class molecular chaperone